MLLPKQKENKKTLVLDLDETLVHSSFDKVENPDVKIPITIEENVYDINVLVRPGTTEFLREMGKVYEIVIFTASMSKYAEPLIKILDSTNVVQACLFREHCTYIDGTFVKDLSRLGRSLRNVILVDNSPICFSLQNENGIPIKSWYEDKKDNELFKYMNSLYYLSFFSDVRQVIPFIVQDCGINHEFIRKSYEKNFNHNNNSSKTKVIETEKENRKVNQMNQVNGLNTNSNIQQLRKSSNNATTSATIPNSASFINTNQGTLNINIIQGNLNKIYYVPPSNNEFSTSTTLTQQGREVQQSSSNVNYNINSSTNKENKLRNISRQNSKLGEGNSNSNSNCNINVNSIVIPNPQQNTNTYYTQSNSNQINTKNTEITLHKFNQSQIPLSSNTTNSTNPVQIANSLKTPQLINSVNQGNTNSLINLTTNPTPSNSSNPVKIQSITYKLADTTKNIKVDFSNFTNPKNMNLNNISNTNNLSATANNKEKKKNSLNLNQVNSVNYTNPIPQTTSGVNRISNIINNNLNKSRSNSNNSNSKIQNQIAQLKMNTNSKSKTTVFANTKGFKNTKGYSVSLTEYNTHMNHSSKISNQQNNSKKKSINYLSGSNSNLNSKLLTQTQFNKNSSNITNSNINLKSKSYIYNSSISTTTNNNKSNIHSSYSNLKQSSYLNTTSSNSNSRIPYKSNIFSKVSVSKSNSNSNIINDSLNSSSLNFKSLNSLTTSKNKFTGQKVVGVGVEVNIAERKTTPGSSSYSNYSNYKNFNLKKSKDSKPSNHSNINLNLTKPNHTQSMISPNNNSHISSSFQLNLNTNNNTNKRSNHNQRNSNNLNYSISTNSNLNEKTYFNQETEPSKPSKTNKTDNQHLKPEIDSLSIPNLKKTVNKVISSKSKNSNSNFIINSSSSSSFNNFNNSLSQFKKQQINQQCNLNSSSNTKLNITGLKVTNVFKNSKIEKEKKEKDKEKIDSNYNYFQEHLLKQGK